MANIYVYSTMSSDNNYAEFSKLPNGLHKKSNEFLVAGKANVVNKKTLVTPIGMMTTFTEAEYNKFKENDMFKRHVKRGFITVSKTRGEADDVAKDMTEKDKSAQLTAEKLKADDVAKDMTEKDKSAQLTAEELKAAK